MLMQVFNPKVGSNNNGWEQPIVKLGVGKMHDNGELTIFAPLTTLRKLLPRH